MQYSLSKALRAAGLDPETDVYWVYDPVFAYRTNIENASGVFNIGGAL